MACRSVACAHPLVESPPARPPTHSSARIHIHVNLSMPPRSSQRRSGQSEQTQIDAHAHAPQHARTHAHACTPRATMLHCCCEDREHQTLPRPPPPHGSADSAAGQPSRSPQRGSGAARRALAFRRAVAAAATHVALHLLMHHLHSNTRTRLTLRAGVASS